MLPSGDAIICKVSEQDMHVPCGLILRRASIRQVKNLHDLSVDDLSEDDISKDSQHV